jgi:hypothetical protein
MGNNNNNNNRAATAVREEKLRACTNYDAFDRLAAHDRRWLQQ